MSGLDTKKSEAEEIENFIWRGHPIPKKLPSKIRMLWENATFVRKIKPIREFLEEEERKRNV